MRVGLDTICLNRLKLDPMGLAKKVVEYNLEGMQLGGWELLKRDDEYKQEFKQFMRDHNLYLDLNGAGVNPRDSGKSVAEMVERWEPLFPLAADMGATTLNSCFGLYQERMMTSPSFAEQFEMTTQVLKELAKRGADYGVVVTMELHIDLTASEMVRLMEAVDSPWVGVNLDTANPLGLCEDPVEAAMKVAPYAKTTHYKDSCIFLTKDGFNWQGGAPLGTGLVDLVTITKELYRCNPNINLNIEDGWGYIPIPFFDEGYINSLPELTPAKLAKFVKDFMLKGEKMMLAGIHPYPTDVTELDSTVGMNARLWQSAEYARRLRDDIEGRNQ